MRITDYIAQQFQDRLSQSSGIFVLYDPKGLYREIFATIDSSDCKLIYADESTIQARVDAEKALLGMAKAKPEPKQLAIYVPRKAPESEEEKQAEPFSYFSKIGSQFPSGDGDTFHSLCRKAKPAHVVQVDQLFAEGEPSFELVDAIELILRSRAAAQATFVHLQPLQKSKGKIFHSVDRRW